MSDFRDVDFNEAGVKESLNTFPVLRAGWMRFAVDSATITTQDKTDNIQLQLKCSPLDNENRRAGTSTTMQVMLPIYNPRVEGHRIDPGKLKTYAKMTSLMARSLYEDFPWYARKDKDNPGNYITPDGESVDKAKYEAIRREVDAAVVKTAIKWAKDPTTLKDETFYCRVTHTEGRNGGTFANISAFDMRSAPPEGEEVITEDFTE